MIEIILLATTIILFLASLVMLGRSKQVSSGHKETIDRLDKENKENTEVLLQLHNMFNSLNESQKLQIKAFEILLKSQKMTAGDLNEFKDHVANTMVAIIEQISGTTKNGAVTLKFDKSKDGKLN